MMQTGDGILDNIDTTLHLANVFLETNMSPCVSLRKSKHPSSYSVTSMKIAGKYWHGKIWYSNRKVQTRGICVCLHDIFRVIPSRKPI